MIIGIVCVVLAVGAVLVWIGAPRLVVPRRPGFEGIEDLDAARAYDRVSRWPQFRLLRRIIVRKLSGYRPTGILADIGSGPGLMTMLIARNHPELHVVGFDTADEMVRTAELNASNLGLSDRVDFRLGDVSRLPMPDGSLDFALSTLSLHHWSRPSDGLSEINRVLKPGGQLLLFDLRRDARRFIFLLLRFAQSVVVPADLRRINEPLGSLQSSYALHELEELLTQSPFREWKIEGGAGWVFVWARKGASTI